MANEAAGLPAIGNAFAPDVLADDALGFELINGTVRITFGVVKLVEAAPPSPVQMVAIGRLVLPIASAQRFALGLHDYLTKMNLDPAQALRGDETSQ